MKELVKIQTQADGKQAVSARNMYLGLGLEPAHWKRWATKNIEKNIFAEQGRDWQGFTLMVNGNETKDYVLTLDFAKKLSMQVRTEQGEKVRNYFLAVEQKLQDVATKGLTSTVDTARVEMLERKVNALLSEKHEADWKNTEFTVKGFARFGRVSITGNEAQSIGKQASRICKECGLPTGTALDPTWGVVKTYPATVLEPIFKALVKQPRF